MVRVLSCMNYKVNHYHIQTVAVKIITVVAEALLIQDQLHVHVPFFLV